MPKYLRKMAILAKVETTAGTDAVPTGAANAMLVGDVQLTPLEGDSVERTVVRPYFGAPGSKMVTAYSKVAFSIECAGVAALGDVPGYAALMRGCAMAMTNTAGVETIFAPATDSLESLTIYGNIDGIQYKMLNARGTVKLASDAKTIPKFTFEFTGTFVPATDTALPTVVYTAFQEPLGVNKANTTLSLDSYAAACSAFSWDAGNTVVKRDLINVDTIEITARKSTGSVTIEQTSVAVKNWIDMAYSGATLPMTLVHGQGATNVVELSSQYAQIGKPTFSEVDGIQMVTLPLEFIPSSAGNDEWAFSVH